MPSARLDSNNAMPLENRMTIHFDVCQMSHKEFKLRAVDPDEC